MMGEIRRMREEPIAADVLGKRRTQLVGDFVRQVATTKMLGNFLANLAVQGLPMSEYASYISKLQAVTPEQVTASVAAEIDPAQASLIIVGRASEFLEALRSQHPNVEVIPIGELDLGSASLRRRTP
jgi:zinc protease